MGTLILAAVLSAPPGADGLLIPTLLDEPAAGKKPETSGAADAGDDGLPGPSLEDLNREMKYPVDGDAWLEDPFLVLDSEMDFSASDLMNGRAATVVRSAGTTQPRIIRRMDRLVELLTKKCNGSGPAGLNASKPAADSSLAGGPGGVGDLRDNRDKDRGMERLPDAEREKIMQARADGFPPGFEDVLSDYFRRLAEADAPAAGTGEERE